MLSFYRALNAAGTKKDKLPAGARSALRDDPNFRLPWHQPAAEVRAVAAGEDEDLHRLYLDTMAGLLPSTDVLCDVCKMPFKPMDTKFSDGVYRWHPTCDYRKLALPTGAQRWAGRRWPQHRSPPQVHRRKSSNVSVS